MKNKIILVLLIVIGLLGCLIGGYYFGNQKRDNTIDSVTVEAAINEISELATIEYVYTNMAKYESVKEFYGWSIPLTTTKFIVSYDGVIKLGIDLSQVEVEVNGDEVTLTLPEARILSHDIDMSSLQVMDEKYSIFNRIEITDVNQFYADQSAVMEQKAHDRGLFEQAAEKARTSLEALVKSLTEREITVKFK